ncbi:MAG: GNAT family N-acetyltransferase [Anaerolineae bacterium]|nr:MAG: GNAT family N-acetyltransferase [Anaerolineae bacterium]
MAVHIQRADRADDELLAALRRLVPQLTRNHPPPTRADLEALLASEAGTLLIARHPGADGPIVGVLTLVTYRVPTGVRARIEDVVVDEGARGQGIGEALVREGLRLAQQAGADGVALTSNPRRVAANRLYQKIGFKRWETNVYFYAF